MKSRESMTTDPTGTTFISYKRSRSDEIDLLIETLNERGVPSWRDITNLENRPTEPELREVLQRPDTACAVLWVTPDVADSPMILKVEIPEMKQRSDCDPSFFILPVAAGGLGYEDATNIASTHLDLDDLTTWNWEKVDRDPIEMEQAVQVARRLLDTRLRVIDGSLTEDEPFELSIDTWGRPSASSTSCIRIDWSDHFDGRFADHQVWTDRLIPAARDIAQAVSAQNRGRPVVCQGQASISAGLVLGAAFKEPTGIALGWVQNMPGDQGEQLWSLSAPREETPVKARFVEMDVGADALFVGVDFRGGPERAIKNMSQDGVLPKGRAGVIIEGEGGDVDLTSPGQVVDAVAKTVAAIKEAKDRYRTRGPIHLFLAAPVGFAVLLGQKTNALGPIQTYELDQSNGDEVYRPAALIVS